MLDTLPPEQRMLQLPSPPLAVFYPCTSSMIAELACLLANQSQADYDTAYPSLPVRNANNESPKEKVYRLTVERQPIQVLPTTCSRPTTPTDLGPLLDALVVGVVLGLECLEWRHLLSGGPAGIQSTNVTTIRKM